MMCRVCEEEMYLLVSRSLPSLAQQLSRNAMRAQTPTSAEICTPAPGNSERFELGMDAGNHTRLCMLLRKNRALPAKSVHRGSCSSPSTIVCVIDRAERAWNAAHLRHDRRVYPLLPRPTGPRWCS